MADSPRRTRRSSTALPPYRAVLAVDAERYTQTSSYNQRILSNAVRDALEEAFRSCGMEDLWNGAAFPQMTGDGYLVGVAPEGLPFLVHPLMGELQEVLADMQPGLASEDRSLRLRLRAAVGLGPLPDSRGRERGDGIGAPMNDTHRLLDAPVLKAALAQADPDITLLTAGLTARVYEDAVLGGYVGLNPRMFRRADVDLPAKGHRAEAYLYTPRPSDPVPGAQTAARPGGTETGSGGSAGRTGRQATEIRFEPIGEEGR